MNLRWVHAVLILLSAALAVLFGVWCLEHTGGTQGIVSLLAAVTSFAVSLGPRRLRLVVPAQDEDSAMTRASHLRARATAARRSLRAFVGYGGFVLIAGGSRVFACPMCFRRRGDLDDRRDEDRDLRRCWPSRLRCRARSRASSSTSAAARSASLTPTSTWNGRNSKVYREHHD